MTPEQYFTSHSLDSAFIKKSFGVEWNNTTITIPVYGPDKKLLYTKIRHLDYEDHKEEGAVKFTYAPTGGHAALFASYKVKDKKEVVLCEGEPDCMRLWQDGIPAVTSTSGVQAFNPSLAAPLRGKTVYICLDTDKAGVDSVEKYFNALLGVDATPRIVELPTEYKDVCEYFASGKTAQEFRELMAQAITIDDWRDKNEPENFKLISDSELLTLPLPPEEWYIDRVLPTEGFVFFVGAESTGKSFYTLTLAESLTTGKPWLGKFEVKKQTKILFIDKENTKRRTQNRLKGLGIEATGKMFWMMYPETFDLSDEKSETGFSDFAQKLSRFVKKNDIGLIFVDSFTDVMVGNENTSGDVQKFFDGFRQLFPNKTIAVLHHEAKPQQGLVRSSSQKVRGSSNITAQMVVGFRSSPIPKTINEFLIEQIKAGDAEKLPNFKVILATAPDENDATKTSVKSLEYGGEVIDQDMKVDAAIDIIQELFAVEDNIAKAKITEACAAQMISFRTVVRAIKQMEDGGVIDSFPDSNDKRKKIYFLVKEGGNDE